MTLFGFSANFFEFFLQKMIKIKEKFMENQICSSNTGIIIRSIRFEYFQFFSRKKLFLNQIIFKKKKTIWHSIDGIINVKSEKRCQTKRKSKPHHFSRDLNKKIKKLEKMNNHDQIYKEENF